MFTTRTARNQSGVTTRAGLGELSSFDSDAVSAPRASACLPCGGGWIVAQIFNLPYRAVSPNCIPVSVGSVQAQPFPNPWRSATLGYSSDTTEYKSLRYDEALN